MEETDEDFAKCGISMEEQEHGEEEALTRDECVDPEATHVVEKKQESDHKNTGSSSSGKAQNAAAVDLEGKEGSKVHDQEETLKESQEADKKKGTYKDCGFT